MLKIKKSPSSIIIKLIKLFLFSYIIILFLSIVITLTGVISLKYYKKNLETFISNYIGYQIKIGNITGTLNNNLLPEIELTNIYLFDKQAPQKNIKLNKLILVLSYKSLLKFNLIFNNIIIENTTLLIQKLKNNNFSINNLIIKQDLGNNNKFDFIKWLLAQHNIQLNKINLNLIDHENNIPQIDLKNVNLSVTNGIFNKHTVNLRIFNENQNVFVKFDLNSNDIFNIKSWDSANLQVKIVNNNSNINTKIRQFIPNIDIFEPFNSRTAIDMQIKNGLLEKLFLNLSIQNFIYIFGIKNNILNITNLEGTLNIKLNKKSNQYEISANNLNISTNTGSILKNQSLDGNYINNKSGLIKFNTINVKNINNIFNLFHETRNINVQGLIKNPQYNWDGNIFKPKNFHISFNIESFAIFSKEESIPSINNVNAFILINKESGQCNISLKNSTFIYKSLFYQPYKIIKLDSSLYWVIESTKNWYVNLNNTIINASNFNIITHGKYQYIKNTSGYLTLYASLDKLPANQVGFYLPKSIHTANFWLQKALLSGNAKNAKLELAGNLDDFPFSNNKGKFNIDANIDNVKMQYIKNWPSIDNIYGTFKIKNQKIIINIESANISGNNITSASAIIPDMTHQKSYLEAIGYANGDSLKFIKFLRDSPLNQSLEKFPDNIYLTGHGNLKINVKVPFWEPNLTNVNGQYQFIDNNLEFNYNIPNIKKMNGVLNFTEKSINVNNLNANIYNGNSNIKIKTLTNSDIIFHISNNNLNYQELAKQYTPILTPFISGSSKTEINFKLNKGGYLESLNANSNMQNIKLDLPKPIYKESLNNKQFLFNMLHNNKDNNFHINFNYESNLLKGNLAISKENSINSLNINLGNNINKILNDINSKFNVRIETESFVLNEWYDFIDKLSNESYKNYRVIDKFNNKKFIIKNNHKKHTIATDKIESISIGIYTDNFFVANYNLGNLYANILINNNHLLFNFSNSMFNGYVTYNITDKNLYINIYNLILKYKLKNFKIENEPTPYINKNLENLNFESISIYEIFKNQIKIVETKSNINSAKIINIPNTQINIENLIAYGYKLGKLKTKIFNINNNIRVESGSLLNKYANINFSGTSYCHNCKELDKLNSLDLYFNIIDMGKFLNFFNLNNIIDQGKGKINLSIQSRGNINNITYDSIATIFKVNLKNGKLKKVDTGDLLGSIIGILNLQSVVNLLQFNFSNIFSNGFAFNELTASGYIINNIIYFRYIFMSGTLAQISVNGNININNKQLDLMFSVRPNLGAGVAITAGILTGPIGPIIGLATYIGQLILGNPLNKLLTITFNVTGSINKPIIKQIGVNNQIIKNISDTISM
jgi:uncharacterized protein (TIGR02099 family)